MSQAEERAGTESQVTKESIQGLSYEEAYNRLESVLERLESGDLPLDEALSLYETGSLLAAHCAHKLEEAELKVRQWQANNEVSKFEDWE